VSAEHTAPVVLVDARNVMRSRWPNFRDDRFLALLEDWAEQEGVPVIAVFDGTAPEGTCPGEQPTVVGTGTGSADDWIVDEARRLAADRQPAWLVSSDRGLRERVSGDVERILGGGAFASQLETLENRDVGRRRGQGEARPRRRRLGLGT
jgi:YacP-like NYN domain